MFFNVIIVLIVLFVSTNCKNSRYYGNVLDNSIGPYSGSGGLGDDTYLIFIDEEVSVSGSGETYIDPEETNSGNDHQVHLTATTANYQEVVDYSGSGDSEEEDVFLTSGSGSGASGDSTSTTKRSEPNATAKRPQTFPTDDEDYDAGSTSGHFSGSGSGSGDFIH